MTYAIGQSQQLIEYSMAKPNYAFAKRQRDLAKKQAKEEKKLKKAAASEVPPEATEPLPPVPDKAVE